MKLASFDIFDTTLIRKCGLPGNVFYLLAHRLFPEDSAKQEDFLLWRNKAEQRARQRKGTGEVTLANIYEDDGLSAYGVGSITELMEAERAVEAAMLVALPSTRQLIERKRAEGYTICFISDMYLDSALLSEILRREHCLKGDERVFVSCEHEARKSNGKLLDKVRAELQPSVWEHFGDHPHSDVKMPRRKGIHASRLEAVYTEIETLILRRAAESASPYRLSILAGLSRAVRCLHGEASYAELAADFVAPAYIPYVDFILRDARKRGINKLYFLSRDSYILMKVAETYRRDYPEIEQHYFFVSRRALLLPYLNDATADTYLAVQDKRTILRRNVNDLLSGLDSNRLEMEQQFGIVFDYDRIYGKKEEKDFLEKIFGLDSPFLPELKRRIKAQRELLTDYFRQEGLLTPGQVGLIDVGWLGTSRHMINCILKSMEGAETIFYYFGIRRDVMPWKNGAYASFYRPEQLSTELTALVENYFSASPYPSTKCYERRNDKVEPVFKDKAAAEETPVTQTNTEVLIWILKEMKSLLIDFTPAFHDWARLSLEAITHLSVKADLSALSKVSDFDDASFVRKLSILELLRLTFLGEHITAFDRASLHLSLPDSLAKFIWNCHSLSGRLRRFIYRLKTR